ncbi:MAG: nucleotide exchange factor GrpE [Cyanobacteria bacterium P01_F01_bin.143]
MANENNENKVNPNLSDENYESENADPTGESTPGSLVEEQVEPEVETSESLEHNLGDNPDETPESNPTSNEIENLDSEEEITTEVPEEEQSIIEEKAVEDSAEQNTEAASAIRPITDSSANKKNMPLDKIVEEREQEILAENKSLKQEIEDLREQIEVKDNEIKEKDQRVEDNAQEIENIQEEIARLKEENEAKDQEIERLKNPLLMLIDKKLEEQEKDLEEDRQELASYFEQVQKWTKRNQSLQEGIKLTVEKTGNILSQSQEVKNKLPQPLQEKLQKRQEGLNLIGKMLGRLQEQINAKIEEPAEPEELPTVSEQELRDLLDPEADEKSGENAIAKKLKEVGTQRWKIVAQQRDLAEKLRKKWLNIIDKKILPIIDGIDDGAKFSDNLIQQLKTENSEQITELDNWVGTYHALRELFLDMLVSVKVYLMKVDTRQQIDYNRHEPFDVQSDPNLNNEDIKEVTRQGYEYEPEAEGQEMLVLRSAQVVVVKNN